MRNLIEAILLGLDGSPVAGLSGLPLTNVALGLNVGETRDRACLLYTSLNEIVDGGQGSLDTGGVANDAILDRHVEVNADDGQTILEQGEVGDLSLDRHGAGVLGLDRCV